MARIRSLLDVSYWALMWLLAACRFLICWAYFLLFIGSFGAFMSQVKDAIVHFEPRALLAIAYLAAVFFLSSAAWWTTLCQMPSHRIWVVFNALVNVLTVGIMLVLIPSFAPSHVFIWILLLVGIAGLVAYLPPYRLNFSVDIFSYRAKSPDQSIEELHISL